MIKNDNYLHFNFIKNMIIRKKHWKRNFKKYYYLIRIKKWSTLKPMSKFY